MDREYFLDCLEFTNRELCKLEIHRAYNSIGSNIFLKFGRQIEEYLPNGEKTLTSEWTIWLSNTSWRITQYGKYIVGSNDDLELMHQILENFIGKHFHSINIISRYLDAQFEFENGYKLETFFNWSVENQWILFLPNGKEIVVDYLAEGSVKLFRNLFSRKVYNFIQKNRFISLLDSNVDRIVYCDNSVLKLFFSNNYCVELGRSAWRFEKNRKYYVGSLDYYFGSQEGREEDYKKKISQLIGKKIKQISIDPLEMDLKLAFEGKYSLEIFTHAQLNQWKILQNNEVICCANILK